MKFSLQIKFTLSQKVFDILLVSIVELYTFLQIKLRSFKMKILFRHTVDGSWDQNCLIGLNKGS